MMREIPFKAAQYQRNCHLSLMVRGGTQAAVSGGSSWESMRMSHASMVDLQRHLAQNVEEESNAFFTFMDSALRKVFPPPLPPPFAHSYHGPPPLPHSGRPCMQYCHPHAPPLRRATTQHSFGTLLPLPHSELAAKSISYPFLRQSSSAKYKSRGSILFLVLLISTLGPKLC